MSPRVATIVRRSIATSAILFVCGALFLFSPRLLALPMAVAMAVTLLLWVCGKRGRNAGITAAAFVVVSLAPVDVRPQHWFGVPRIVPLVMGYPSHEMFEAARKGEIWLGGCIASGLEPRWIVTW